VETESGIDIRRTWQREAESAGGRLRAPFANVSAALARGDSLTSALRHSNRVFPRLFLEMVQAGEESGSLGRVFSRLERNYRRHAQARRVFLAAIAWPMLQLAFAVFVVGFLIWFMGVLARRNDGQPIDLLGFGLIGTRGLAIYINFLLVVGLCLAGLVMAMQRGLLWTRPLQRALIHVPYIGGCLQKLALARFAWALQLTLNVAMDMRRVVPLALRATQNDYYIRHTDQIVARVADGQTLTQAMAASGAFPGDFLDELAVGEESGRLVESMGRLADRYEQETEMAVKVLAVAIGFVVFAFVAALIIWLIFRLFAFYVGTIESFLP
jgi:type II secretory pathway component PulF